MAKRRLRVVRGGGVPLPDHLHDTGLLLWSGSLLCDFVCVLDCVYASKCVIRSTYGPSPGPYDPQCWLRCLVATHVAVGAEVGCGATHPTVSHGGPPLLSLS